MKYSIYKLEDLVACWLEEHSNLKGLTRGQREQLQDDFLYIARGCHYSVLEDYEDPGGAPTDWRGDLLTVVWSTPQDFDLFRIEGDQLFLVEQEPREPQAEAAARRKRYRGKGSRGSRVRASRRSHSDRKR